MKFGSFFNSHNNGKKHEEQSITQPLLVNEVEEKSSSSSNSVSVKPNEHSLAVIKRNPPYKWNEMAIDGLLLAFAVWSQFGYSYYSQENSMESVSDPMERYLYPHITSEQAEQISNYLKYVTTGLSYADAALTVGTYLNMRHCRKELMDGLRKGIEEYKNKKISPIMFGISCFLILSSFIAGSFPSWTGLERKDYNTLRTNIFGATMFVGLMISYSMSYAPYIFSASKNLTDFHKLSWKEKKTILRNVFCTTKGLLGFLPRSIISVVNRSWIFYGSANLTATWVFKTQKSYIRYPYAVLAGFGCGYQTFMSQGIKDYQVTFNSPKDTTDGPLAKTNQNHSGDMNACNKLGLYSFNAILGLLVVAVFILRTLAVPSLYTGEVKDPADNYSYKDTVLGLLGLLLGGYGAFQYARFRFSR